MSRILTKKRQYLYSSRKSVCFFGFFRSKEYNECENAIFLQGGPLMKRPAVLLVTLSLLVLLFGCTPKSEPDIESTTVEAPSTASSAKETVSTTNPVGAPYTPPTAVLTSETITEAFGSSAFLDTTTGTVLPFRIYLPEGYREDGAYPLLLFLHGIGQCGNDNCSHIQYAVPNFFSDLNSPVYGSIMVCPQCPEGQQWVDTDFTQGNYSLRDIPVSSSLHAALELVYYVSETYAVDPSRIYVTGLSIGGFGTWDICMRAPDLFAAALPVCGAGSPDDVSLIQDLPITTVHGDADTRVPVSGTRAMVNALKAYGNEPVYFELAGYSHNVWDWTYTNSQILNWLFSQTKTAN